jgi:hypothetical protein
LRLATSGYYEEALSQVRSVAEGINLLQLFILDPPKLPQWRADPLSLQPGAVRGLIEGHTVSPLISRATYKALCELATHISPNYLSLSHFPTGDVYVGATWSVAGITLVAGQTATVLGSALAIATRILGVMNKAKLTRIRKLVTRLFKDAPDIDAERYKSFITDFSHEFRRESLVKMVTALPREDLESLGRHAMIEIRKRLPDLDPKKLPDDFKTETFFPMMRELLLEAQAAAMREHEQKWRTRAGTVAFAERLEARAQVYIPNLLKPGAVSKKPAVIRLRKVLTPEEHLRSRT